MTEYYIMEKVGPKKFVLKEVLNFHRMYRTASQIKHQLYKFTDLTQMLIA